MQYYRWPLQLYRYCWPTFSGLKLNDFKGESSVIFEWTYHIKMRNTMNKYETCGIRYMNEDYVVVFTHYSKGRHKK